MDEILRLPTHMILDYLCREAGGREAVATHIGWSKEALDKKCQGVSRSFLDDWFKFCSCLRSVPQDDGRLGINQHALDSMAAWAANLADGYYTSPRGLDR